MSNTGRNFVMEKRQAIAGATSAQREAGAIEYAAHCRACVEIGIKPAPFDSFFYEWLDSQQRGEIEAARDLDGDRDREASIYYRRDYERQYDGKRGWD